MGDADYFGQCQKCGGMLHIDREREPNFVWCEQCDLSLELEPANADEAGLQSGDD